MKFKTNINCNNCVAKVQTTLDGLVGAGNWQVDINNPEKILDIKNLEVAAQDVTNKLKRIGFSAEEVG
ncbi:MAG: heavy-metal-associated domain-containing protein [Cytophagaceae bacterium]|nr:heavy-metal-associated domain-containing protein [Cytophagaceae bacterium]MBL0300185.1 heavy-metal-associated domain-containing protein [Cytophagaceae bacterium]MBL0327121.1 heavy-metal-associated domain-containing protein [Cytophagaceae bacterium]